MRTVLENDSAVWIPNETPDTHDTYRVVDDASEARVTVTVPRGVDMPPTTAVVTDGVTRITVVATHRTKIGAVIPTIDAVALWRPGSHRDDARIASNWEPEETISALNDLAIGSLLGAGDRSLITFGATAGTASLRLRVGMSEETAELMLFVEVDGEPERPVTVSVDLDLRGLVFAESVQQMRDLMHGPRAAVAEADERPVYSTWYVFHQELDQADVEDQAVEAARLGFGTVIIDDGWQSRDTQRGYGTTGDWRLQVEKFPEARALVGRLDSLGLRTMWWIGTPFIGDRAEAAGRFPTLNREAGIEASVFDPRSPAARRHLTDRVVQLIEHTGAHGLKLDFVERFTHLDTERDEVERAAVLLLRDIRDGISAVSPGASIEFREPYIGPVASELTTMVRVNDCPMSPVRNRIGIVDLRLSTRGVAVHADPVMWAMADSPERVAQHLINTLFGVPQISVDLLRLPRSQASVLGFWIDFVNTHRDVLLHGEFIAERPDLGYPLVTSHKDGTVITARYQPTAVTVPPGEWTRWIIANTEADPTTIRGGGDVASSLRVIIRDARGVAVDTRSHPAWPNELTIPVGGTAYITVV